MKKAKVTKDRKAGAKSEAGQSADRKGPPRADFRSLLGIGTKVPINPNPNSKARTISGRWKAIEVILLKDDRMSRSILMLISGMLLSVCLQGQQRLLTSSLTRPYKLRQTSAWFRKLFRR